MKAVALLTLVLSHAGYWFGGADATVELRWALATPPPPIVIEWQLLHGQSVLASGRVEDGPLTLRTPEVRTRTELTLTYRAYERDRRDHLVGEGRETVHVFPRTLLEPLPRLLAGRTLHVLSNDDALSALLTEAGVTTRRVASLDGLLLVPAPLLIVDKSALDTPVAAMRVAELAERGGRVAVFRQTDETLGRLGGLPLATRATPETWEWRGGHPLFRGLSESDLASWDREPAMFALRIADDVPAVELAWWPRGTSADTTVDAAVATRSIGRGRVVLWQLDLGPWREDPRSQVVLVNVLDDLLAAVQPTPPRIEREEWGRGKRAAPAGTPGGD